LAWAGRKETRRGMLCSSVQSGRETEQRERGRENAAGRAGALLKRGAGAEQGAVSGSAAWAQWASRAWAAMAPLCDARTGRGHGHVLA